MIAPLKKSSTLRVRLARRLAALIIMAPLAGCASYPMVRAIERGRPGEVQALLDKGYDLNARMGTAQMTPLKLAAAHRSLDRESSRGARRRSS